MTKTFATMFVFAMLCVPAIAEAQQQLADGEARALVCGPGEIQVCTETQADGSAPRVMYLRGSPVIDCVVRSETGIQLECVKWEDACKRESCDRRGGNWHWDESSCHCDYERPRESPPPSAPPAQPPGPTTPPVQPGPTPTCPDCNVSLTVCPNEEIARLANELAPLAQVAPETWIVRSDTDELRTRVLYIRDRAAVCGEDRIFVDAERVLAAMTPPEPSTLPSGPPMSSYEDEENFCTNSFGGVLVCIVLPTVAAGAAIFLGVWFGTEWEATQE
ncbi:hypothetical protein HZB93_00625 [Candidatus Falkowbacteria bacterium]|nr:hypothetical protein [Candidatus Falkowbacteria bacterium]